MALIANAKAGALLGQESAAGSLEEQLRAASGGLTVIPPEAGSLPDRVAAAVATGADCVVVAGGDGSIACAAAALAGTEQALGMIPCGTMNLMAKDLGLDPENREACVQALATGQIRTIDAGCVSGKDGAEHLFLCASMLGLPARLSRHREAGRRSGNGVLAWAGFGMAATRSLFSKRSRRLELRFDGRVLERRTPSVTVVVNKLDDSTGRLFGRANLEGGKLAIYVVKRASTLRQLWLLLRTAVTGSLRAPEIEVFETTSVEITGRRAGLHVLVDGEMRLLAGPLRYEIRPHAVHVIAPARP